MGSSHHVSVIPQSRLATRLLLTMSMSQVRLPQMALAATGMSTSYDSHEDLGPTS